MALRISLVFFVSVGFVIGLNHFSIWHRGYIGGGFLRSFPPAPLLSFKSFDLGFNSFYVAGLSGENIYLANVRNPFKLVVTGKSLEDTAIVRIELQNENFIKGAVKTYFDSSQFYLLNGIQPVIYAGSESDFKVYRISSDSVFFKDAIPLNSRSFIYRSESADTHRDVMIRNSISSGVVQVDTTLLERQIDGIFCTDGMLHYSKSMDSIVYVYYYRNQYIVADTGFTKISRYRTIDTTSRARIEVGEIKSSKTKTILSPPVVVNRRSCISDGWLYIQSGLVADNQKPTDLNYYEIIDVYNLSSHGYHFSFYLPFERRTRMTSFKVQGHTLVVLFGQHLFVYEISPSVFE